MTTFWARLYPHLPHLLHDMHLTWDHETECWRGSLGGLMVLILQGDNVILIDGQAPVEIVQHLARRDGGTPAEVHRILARLVGQEPERCEPPYPGPERPSFEALRYAEGSRRS